MLIGLVTEGEEEGEEGEEGKSHSKVGTRWVRQKLLKNDWLYDEIYHVLVEYRLINCWSGAFCGHRGRREAVVPHHQ